MNIELTKGFTQKTCKGCGVIFFIPDELEKKFYDEGGYWFCPNGHQYQYTEPESIKYRKLYLKELEEKNVAQKNLDFARTARDNAIKSAKRIAIQLSNLRRKTRKAKGKS